MMHSRCFQIFVWCGQNVDIETRKQLPDIAMVGCFYQNEVLTTFFCAYICVAIILIKAVCLLALQSKGHWFVPLLYQSFGWDYRPRWLLYDLVVTQTFWSFRSFSLLAHLSRRLIGEILGRHPSSVRRQHFQMTSPLKPWSRLLPNCVFPQSDSCHWHIMGKEEICCFTADVLTKNLQKCSLSSPLPNIWILSKPLNLIGCHGNRNVKKTPM